MRLLRYGISTERWHIDDFHGKHVPFYAILSHAWGPEDEGVTFESVQDHPSSSNNNIRGHEKLIFTRRKAAEDGLSYFWIDTCCIKKSDSTELQRSLNSMFFWYQRAAVCYVWLEDVSIADRIDEELPWKTPFARSRWFKRGWTLQELIAPKLVIFFSKEGDRLGDKQSLASTLSAVTGIPEAVLLGAELSRFSKDARFSWAKGRVTKVPEDAAYSLIGIFGVTLPMLYADGNYKRRKQAALDELDSAIERTSGRNTSPKDVVRIGGASFEDLEMLDHRQLHELDAALDAYIDGLVWNIDFSKNMSGWELLENSISTRARFEKELQDVLKTFGVAYKWESDYKQPKPFMFHASSSFDKLRWMADVWHVYGCLAVRTVLDLKTWIKSNNLI